MATASGGAAALADRLDALIDTPQRYVDLLCFRHQVSLMLEQVYGDCADQDLGEQDVEDMHALRALDNVLAGYVKRINSALPRHVCACTCDMDALERGVQLHRHPLPGVLLGSDGEPVLAGLRVLARELREGLFVDLATTARLWARFCRLMAAILEVIEPAPKEQPLGPAADDRG